MVQNPGVFEAVYVVLNAPPAVVVVVVGLTEPQAAAGLPTRVKFTVSPTTPAPAAVLVTVPVMAQVVVPLAGTLHWALVKATVFLVCVS